MKGRISVILLLLILLSACQKAKLPKYFPTDIQGIDTTFLTLPPIHLTNQHGKTIDQTYLKGRIWVADFFFATCPGICKIMSANMAKVQDALKDEAGVELLSISVDAYSDSVPVLLDYAKKYSAIEGKWHLCTGDTTAIYDLARHYFHVSALQDPKAEGGIFHDQRFILVDKQGVIRGYYMGTEKEALDKLALDVKRLKEEE